jgi:hypothetical protein
MTEKKRPKLRWEGTTWARRNSEAWAWLVSGGRPRLFPTRCDAKAAGIGSPERVIRVRVTVEEL